MLVLERDNLTREREFEVFFEGFFFFLYREMRRKENEEREKAKSRSERKVRKLYASIREMEDSMLQSEIGIRW